MNKVFTFKRCASAIGLVAITALSQNVLASGYGVRELSVWAQGSAYSGASSSTDSITYMYFNPAMLVHQMGHQVESGLFNIFPHSTVTDTNSISPAVRSTTTGAVVFPPAPVLGADDHNNLGKYALTGNFYGLYDLCNDLKFGLAVTSPWGLVTDYGSEKNWIGRFHALHSDLKTVNINPMVSYRFNDHWSFGAGFEAQYMAAELTNKIGFSSTFLGVASHGLLADPSYEPFARIQGYGWGYGFNVGVMWQPWESTTIGVGYRSQIAHDLGHQKSEILQPIGNYANLYANILGPTNPSVLALEALTLPIPYKVDAKAKVRTPGQINFGITHHITDRWAVMGDAQWTQWSNLNELRVRFEDGGPLLASDSVIKTDWRDAWWGALGTSYEINCHWVIRGGIAYDESPAKSEQFATPRIPDSNRLWLSVGATYHINYHFSVNASYSHIFAQDTSIHIPATSPQGAASGTLNANYSSQRVDIIGVDGIYRF
jgi:long-chain fatty acid transport protein